MSSKTTYHYPDGSVTFDPTLIVTGTGMPSRIEQLERENAALRELTSTLGAPNHINVPVEQWRELSEDKERLNWLLTYEGGSWIYWAIENGEWTPEVAASRAAIDANRKEAQP